ncbi:MAG: O-antigen ligase family protein [Rhodomicrobium sp.]|jgi:O-antigen ligase
MVVVFYVATVYDRELAGWLFYMKWLTVLPVIALSWRAAGRVGVALAAPPSSLPLVLIAFAALLSVFAALDMGQSAVIFISLVFALVTAFTLAMAIMRTGGERQFFDAIALVGRLVIASAAAMWPLGLSLGRGDVARFSAWTDNPNTLALLLAPTLVILMAEVLSRRRGWLWRSLPFLAVGCFLLLTTGSRASQLWVLVSALGFYSFRQGVGLSFLLAVVALMLGSLYWGEIASFILGLARREETARAHDVLSGRSEVWPIALRLFGEQPILGHGIGSSQSILIKYNWLFSEAQGLHFHNSYLTVAVETGVMGLIAVGFALSLSLVGGARRAKRARREGLAAWPMRALPWALAIGSLAHAFFETWLLSAGNSNMILMWTCFLLLQEKATATHRPAYRSAQRKSAQGAPRARADRHTHFLRLDR